MSCTPIIRVKTNALLVKILIVSCLYTYMSYICRCKG